MYAALEKTEYRTCWDGSEVPITKVCAEKKYEVKVEENNLKFETLHSLIDIKLAHINKENNQT